MLSTVIFPVDQPLWQLWDLHSCVEVGEYAYPVDNATLISCCVGYCN